MMFPLATVLTRVETLMSTWGYPMLFLALFSCGLGVPLPEDIPLLLAGYFVATGKMHLVAACAAAWAGIVGGDCMLYSFGYRYGLNITKVPIIGTHVTTDRVKWVELKFLRYGTWVVAVGRMVAGVRGAMVIAAGTIRFSFWRFLLADGLAAIVSGGAFMAIGYYFGTKLGDLDTVSLKIQHYEHRVIGIGAILLVVLCAYFYIQHRRHAKAAPPAPPATPLPNVAPGSDETTALVKTNVDA